MSVAFGIRNEKSQLVDTNKRQDDSSNIAVAVSLTSRINLRGFNCVETKPSYILKDHAKVELLISTFDPNGKLNTLTKSKMFTDILNKANILFVLLKTRFNTHVKRKVKACQQANRCLPWVNKNLAVAASWMIVASHLKDDISCLDESKCLLSNPCGNNFLVCFKKELDQLG